MERAALTHWINVTKRKLEREELMLLWCNELIIKSLDSDDPKVLVTRLKITLEQANAILDLHSTT